jgi:hypothetical protein
MNRMDNRLVKIEEHFLENGTARSQNISVCAEYLPAARKRNVGKQLALAIHIFEHADAMLSLFQFVRTRHYFDERSDLAEKMSGKNIRSLV